MIEYSKSFGSELCKALKAEQWHAGYLAALEWVTDSKSSSKKEYISLKERERRKNEGRRKRKN